MEPIEQKMLIDRLDELLADLFHLEYKIELMDDDSSDKDKYTCEFKVTFNIRGVVLFYMYIGYDGDNNNTEYPPFFIFDRDNNTGTELELNNENFYYTLSIFYTDFIYGNIEKTKETK